MSTEKILKISACDSCPHLIFDDPLDTTKWGKYWCNKLDAEIKDASVIPANCPLPTVAKSTDEPKSVEAMASTIEFYEALARADTTSLAPCGHLALFSYSTDSVGKNVDCVLCALAGTEMALDTLATFQRHSALWSQFDVNGKIARAQKALNHFKTK